jgi:sigma-B regulation protein RsbU (phosphoserine phosphatase)
VLDTNRGQLLYANAGHCRPLWAQAATGEVRELDARGIILGAVSGAEIEERAITIEPGDLVVFYTDGVTEAMDSSHQFFGEERLEAIVADKAGASAQEVLEAIVEAVRAFSGGIAQSDDLAILVVRRSPQST